ncbi:MAG: ABC transporter ATP-binding protein [Methylocystis sp.]|nr:ABC transporter ATP-binding protein [Methylocystis sp.]MCA3587479.1 ABC transporter ATP-binding protein [Methylocystis sp.]MCA3591030.1 ABC transporter ATP-binding protein [Methylocystis sp.]
MTEAALTISYLSIHDRNGIALVDDVSLSVPRGGVLTLIGETGSGKSLIAQAVFGLLPAGLSVSGTITISGHKPIPASEPKRLAALWREQIMLIPQEPSAALDPTMRVKRQMALAGLHEEAIKPALAAFDLPGSTGDAYPFTLSGGMAQRVLVASALGVGAPIVVADEPTKGLDADRVTQAIATLKRLSAAGRSLLVITHDRRLAEELPGELAIIRDGRVEEHGPSAGLLSAPQSDYARTWLAADPRHWPRCHRCCDMTSLALSAHGLSFGWPKRGMLFEDLDLHVPRGGVLAISGPSGSGKSTLGDILLGLRRPTAGSVEWGGINIVAGSSAIKIHRQRYQKLHQDPITAFVPHLNFARQFLALQDVKSCLSVARDLPPLLERLKVNHRLMNRRPCEVSGGEAQRLALARILLLDPIAIVADEPTSRLDPVVQRETMLLLRAIVDQRGLGLVLISHDQTLLAAIADEHLALSPRP